MQKALSLAVLLGSMLQLQGCGGGTTPTSAPATDAPTTVAPPADQVYAGSFTLSGMTLAQANTDAVKTAIGAGLAEAAGVDASYVEITSITTARRLDEGRRLQTDLKVDYEVTIPGTGGAAAQTSIANTLTAALDAADFATTALTAIKAAIAASPDIPAATKTAAESATVSAFTEPACAACTGASNSTRRLSFSFVSSDEPLIL